MVDNHSGEAGVAEEEGMRHTGRLAHKVAGEPGFARGTRDLGLKPAQGTALDWGLDYNQDLNCTRWDPYNIYFIICRHGCSGSVTSNIKRNR